MREQTYRRTFGGKSIRKTVRCCVDMLESRLHLDGTRFAWGAFVGKDALDSATAVAVDKDGNTVVAGSTQSIGWFDQSLFNGKRTPDDGIVNGYVAKFSPSGEMIWGTYIGGPSGEEASAVTTDSSGNIYVAGTTYGNFTAFGPEVSKGERPVESYHGGASDGFAVGLTADGQFIWATTLGGAGTDTATGITVSADRVVVSGTTDSDGRAYFNTGKLDDPTTPNIDESKPDPLGPQPYGQDFGGGTDGFVSAVGTAKGNGMWLDYLPGSGNDAAMAVTADDKQVFVTGASDSPDLYGLCRQYSGTGTDAFILHIDPQYASYMGFTFLNTNAGGYDSAGTAISMDSYGNPIVAGTTHATSLWPKGQYFGSSSESTNAFTVKLINALVFAKWGTVTSGNGDIAPTSVAVDSKDDSIIIGAKTNSSTISVSKVDAGVYGVGLRNTNPNAEGDTGLVLKIDAAGRPDWGQFFGATNQDASVNGVALDANHAVVAVGDTASVEWPAGVPFINSPGGAGDGFAVKMVQSTSPAYSASPLSNVTLDNVSTMSPYTLAITYSDPGGILRSSLNNSVVRFYQSGALIGTGQFVSATSSKNASTIVATYSLQHPDASRFTIAPDGTWAWQSRNNGTYDVTLVGGVVQNVDGFAIGKTGDSLAIGSFTVDMGHPTVAITAPSINRATGDYTFSVTYDGHTSPIAQYPEQIVMSSAGGIGGSVVYSAAITAGATPAIAGNRVTVTYLIHKPTAGWPQTSTLMLTVPQGTVSDGFVTNDTTVATLNADTAVPTVVFASPVQQVIPTRPTFSVIYNGTGSTIKRFPSSLTLTAPGATNITATLDSSSVDGSTVVATYRVSAQVRGLYTVVVPARSVRDATSNGNVVTTGLARLKLAPINTGGNTGGSTGGNTGGSTGGGIGGGSISSAMIRASTVNPLLTSDGSVLR